MFTARGTMTSRTAEFKSADPRPHGPRRRRADLLPGDCGEEWRGGECGGERGGGRMQSRARQRSSTRHLAAGRGADEPSRSGRGVRRAGSVELGSDAAEMNGAVPVVYQPSAADVDPDDRGSVYVPMDSWIYPALDRLAGMGFIPSQSDGIRPFTRQECLRQLKEAEGLISGRFFSIAIRRGATCLRAGSEPAAGRFEGGVCA